MWKLHDIKGKYIYYAEVGGGGTEIFSGIKGGALKVRDILKGGYRPFKVLVQKGPGVFSVHSHHS